MVKRVRRLVTGNCQVARICGKARPNGPLQAHTTTMTRAFWDEWSTSKKLHDIFSSSGKEAGLDVVATSERICATKNVGHDPGLCDNLKKCLSDIKGVNELIAHVKTLSTTKFDPQNPDHEAKLERLWKTLLPNVDRQGGRYSKDWGRIGFQQADPASDFRGGGILALDQLLYIAESRTPVAVRMIREPEAEMSRYPWACVGINLTMESIRILESRVIDKTLYGKSLEQGMNVFNDLYANMFEILHARWLRAKPENVLVFPGVLKETLAVIDEEVERTGAVVPPGFV